MDVAVFLLPSLATDAAGTGTVAGTRETDGEGCGDAAGTASDVNTECEPLIPGSDSNKASNMKATAAPMVMRARMFCVPRGPNAVLETLLVKRAPASALPGCSSTTTMSTAQAQINNPYKIYVSKSKSPQKRKPKTVKPKTIVISMNPGAQADHLLRFTAHALS